MKRIVVLGGTGFVGRSVCEQLQADPRLSGGRIVVPSRRRERGKHLFPLPQVDVVQTDVNREADLVAIVQGADVVVNLVAILHGSPAAFEQAHVVLPQRLAAACRQAGVARIVHVSALGVPDQPGQAPSNYLRSKAQGEAALRGSGVPCVILRPSVIFGEHDRFLNLFAGLQRLAPVMPLAGAHARFQPVWVEDVARAIVRAVVGLGSSLGITTTAEGVETQEQLTSLSSEGCTEFQGFLFSEPLPATDMPEIFRKKGTAPASAV